MISASYAQAMSGQRSRTEDGRLHAATAEIEILCGLAAGTGVAETVVADVDRRRYEVIDLFKADLGLKTRS